MAKLIIKLINSVADVVNHDPAIQDRLKVAVPPRLSTSKWRNSIYPAADLSEQISTAGKEASGTGNMKFALNGALTLGTLDGANIEIRDQVGAEHFFTFGLTDTQVRDRKQAGYRPRDFTEHDPELHLALDQIGSGFFSPGHMDLFRPLVDSLLNHDEFMLLADYRAYVDCQDRVNQLYSTRESWIRTSILNVARMGYFSSDRSIQEYCNHIWKVKPVCITLHEAPD
jgi:glycogen phosphorylase